MSVYSHAFDEAFAFCVLAASLPVPPNNKHMRQNRAATKHRLVNTYGTVKNLCVDVMCPHKITLTGIPS
jgi:hypothetical protein